MARTLQRTGQRIGNNTNVKNRQFTGSGADIVSVLNANIKNTNNSTIANATGNVAITSVAIGNHAQIIHY